MKDSIEYRLISAYYGDRKARRSQVPLINHIDEGLTILDAISATEHSKRAFCLHPLLQNDADLKGNFPLVAASTDAHTMMLAMEYRSVANEFLSDKIPSHRWREIRLSPLFEVNEMLVADKVQNMKDFMTYHYGVHERSDELLEYFEKWLSALDINKDTYQRFCERIDKEKALTPS